MDKKAFSLSASAIDELTGTVSGYAAIFGTVDSGGDRILPGAFTKTIQERFRKYGSIPLTWNHVIDDPFGPLGKVTALTEHSREQLPAAILALAPDAKGGLYYEGAITLTDTNRQRMLHLAKGSVTGQSIGYLPIGPRFVKQGTVTIRDLPEIKLFEIAATPIGMMDAAQLTGLKAADPDNAAASEAAAPAPAIKADETADASLAQQAVAIVNRLIAAETAALTTDPDEADDIQVLLAVRGALIGFATDEASEALQTLAARLRSETKAGRRNSSTDTSHLVAAHDALHAVLDLPAHATTPSAPADDDDAKAMAHVRQRLASARSGAPLLEVA